jgi:hypothetical protein
MCDRPANNSTASGEFIHIEQASTARTAEYAKWSQAFRNTFQSRAQLLVWSIISVSNLVCIACPLVESSTVFVDVQIGDLIQVWIDKKEQEEGEQKKWKHEENTWVTDH